MTTTIAQLRLSGASAAAEMDGSSLMQSLLSRSNFDPDAWHVMQERDNALIRSELMHGYASRAFVYEFEIKGTKVRGISVIGARELASQYKGIKSRIVATVEKRGALFIFRTFTPLSIETRLLPELDGEDDYYECVMEIADIKSGNSIEVRKKESKTEYRRDGTSFDRPHYDVICEAKAYRNGVLSILPQSVIRDFQARCLAAGNTSTELTIQEWRAKARAYAAKQGLALDRQALDGLTFDEVTGLGSAAALGLEQFRASAVALGLIGGATQPAADSDDPPAKAPPKSTPKTTPPPTDEWEPTPEEAAAIAAREAAEQQQESPNPRQHPPGRRTRPAGPAME